MPIKYLFLAWSVAALGPFGVRADVAIDVRARHQTMQGFGTSERVFDDPHVFENFDPNTARAATLLTPAQQDEILDQLYTRLRLTWVRPATESGIEPENDNQDPEVTDLSRFNFEWKRTDAHVDYVRRAMARGVQGFFLSPILRENWMGVSTDRDVAEYAEWSMAMIRRWRTLGVELPYFSPANEPGAESNPLSGPFLRDLIKKMGPKLRAEGFRTRFVVSDDLNPSAAYERCSTILADAQARKYVGAIASHLYGEDVSGMERLQNLASRYQLPLWMTEYSRGEMGGNAFDFADRVMHPLIANYNTSLILYMWGFFGQWSGPEFQLITLTHRDEAYTGYQFDKMYYVLGQFSRFVPPGAIRVGASSSNHALKVTAFWNRDTLSIVVINNNARSATEKLSIRGLPGVNAVTATRTSQTENWAELPQLGVADSSFTATFPPVSITTFTAKVPFTVTNSASLVPGPVSPGELVSLFGADLGPEQPFTAQPDPAGGISTSLGGLRALFDDVPAPLLYVSQTQINAMVPFSVAGRSATKVEVEFGGGRVGVLIPVMEPSPALFTVDNSGTGLAAALNEDSSWNSDFSPAPQNTLVTFFATGLSQPDSSGQLSDATVKPLLPITVQIGDKEAELVSASAVSYPVGLFRIGVRVPSGIDQNRLLPVVISQEPASSQPGVVIAVQ